MIELQPVKKLLSGRNFKSLKPHSGKLVSNSQKFCGAVEVFRLVENIFD